MGSADCEPTFRLVPGRPRHVYIQGGLSLPPELGPFLLTGRYRVLAELGHSRFQNSWLLKAPPWIVTTPSPRVLCSASMIGLGI
jgi:hypothetical protein